MSRSDRDDKAEAPTVPARISRDDIEAKFRELQGDVDETADQAVSYVLVAGVAILAGVIVLTFLVGRRKGRKKSTIVEVRRL